MLLLYTQNVRRKDEMQRGRKRVAVVVQRGLALLVHVLLELVLVEDHVDDLLLGQGVALPLLSSRETKQTFLASMLSF